MKNAGRSKKLQDVFLAVAEKACCEYPVCVAPEKRVCKDAYFGLVTHMLEKPICWEDGLKQSPDNRVVLILESPHIDEYKDPNEVWPIQGETGNKVQEYLPKILPEELGNWGLFVVNAIRYQCSQGLILSKGYNRSAKNFVVGNLLLNPIFRSDFIARIRPIVKSAQKLVVLNACTKYKAWNVEESNKEMVSKYLGEIESIHGQWYNDVSHPSYWTKAKVKKMRTEFSRFWAAHRDK